MRRLDVGDISHAAYTKMSTTRLIRERRMAGRRGCRMGIGMAAPVKIIYRTPPHERNQAPG